MDRTVGVREMKARFSHYVDLAQEEGEVVITERGKPVARLVGIRETKRKASLDAFLDELEAEGMLERATKPFSRRQPKPRRAVGGFSVSKAVSRMRR
jgi:prevent-host-death family protein